MTIHMWMVILGFELGVSRASFMPRLREFEMTEVIAELLSEHIGISDSSDLMISI